MLSRRRRDDFSENRLIPTAYAFYDFLPSYAIPAVSNRGCGVGVAGIVRGLRKPEGTSAGAVRVKWALGTTTEISMEAPRGVGGAFQRESRLGIFVQKLLDFITSSSG